MKPSSNWVDQIHTGFSMFVVIVYLSCKQINHSPSNSNTELFEWIK